MSQPELRKSTLRNSTLHQIALKKPSRSKKSNSSPTHANIMTDTKQPQPQQPCRLLDLPPELFDIIVKNLSPTSLGNLLQCNQALHQRTDLWIQRMHTPISITDAYQGSGLTGAFPRTRNECKSGLETSKRRWTAFHTFVTRYPERAASVHRLNFLHSRIMDVDHVKIATSCLSSLNVVDLRGTWLSSQFYWAICWSASRDVRPHTLRVQGPCWRVFEGRVGVRYLVDLGMDQLSAGRGNYRQYRMDASEGCGKVDLRYEGTFRWGEIDWSDCGENKLLIWTAMVH